MTHLFAVLRAHGPAWKRGQPLEAQEGWLVHADLMDAMVAEGFIVLGGPVGADEALLIIRAKDEAEVRARLRADPWGEDMLTFAWIAPWTIRLGQANLSAGVSG
jgi:hypothetical protein